MLFQRRKHSSWQQKFPFIYMFASLTTHPVESNLRSEMQRKFLLHPPLSLVQSLTGPNESRRTSRESKDELIISSSLSEEQVRKEASYTWACYGSWGFTPEKEMSGGGLFTGESHKSKIMFANVHVEHIGPIGAVCSQERLTTGHWEKDLLKINWPQKYPWSVPGLEPVFD